MKCLILRASSLGDIVHTFPAITELKAHRNIQIDYLVDSRFADVVKTNSDITKIWELPFLGMKEFGYINFFYHTKKLIADINKENYDYIIDFHNVLKTSFLNFFLKGKKYTFNKLKEPLPVYTRQFEVSETSKVYRYKELLAKIFDYKYSADIQLDHLKSQTLPSNLELEEKKYILLIVDSSWDTKIPRLDFWQRLIEVNESENLFILNHTSLSQQIVNAYPSVRLLPKMPLAQAIAVVSLAKGVIGVDTGLAHMAASFGVPAVMIFGATDYKFYSFYKNLTNLQANLPCVSCYKKRCKFDYLCYNSLEAKTIWKTLENSIRGKDE